MKHAAAIAAPGHWAEELSEGSVFRAAFETSRAVMFLLDPADGSLVAANASAGEFYGYGQEELAGLDPSLLSLLTRERMLELLAQLDACGGARFCSRHRLRDGQLRDMELDASPLRLRSGRRCLLFIGHDITARRLAEQELRRRESLMRAILECAGDGIGFKDVDGVYREVNPAFCAMMGRPCGEILGQVGRDFFDRRSNAAQVELDRRSLDLEGPVAYEMSFAGPKGPRHLSINKSPVFDAEGCCLGMVAICRDITARREAEAALRASEGLLRAMLQSARDSILVTDERDVVREVNHAFCAQDGREREEILGRPLEELFPGEVLRILRSTSALARQTREPVSYTQRITLDGRERWISVIKTAVVDPGGACLGVVSMGRDVTAQRASELALRRSEGRLSGLIRQAPVGVFETDVLGLLTFANERMQRQTGLSLAALAGDGWLAAVEAGDREDFLPLWTEARAQKRELDRELRLQDTHGRAVWHSCRIRPMSDPGNRFSGFLGVFSDISERKKAEALRQDVESVVRHDLKSPLGSVQNALELLEMLGPLNEEQAEVLREVRGLTRRMQGLISLSLDLHAMELGAFKPELEPVDLRDVVEGLRPELSPLLRGKGLELVLESADQPADGPFLVLGERRLLDAVFSNLLKNAAEASPEGGRIEVRLWREGGVAVALLRNAGEAPAEVRDRFFDKYATAGKSGGTGLGTYSARLMLRTMGGALAANFAEAGHTSLELRLPAANAS